MNLVIMEKKILTTREVAEFFGLSPQEVRRLADLGYLKRLPGFDKPFKFSRRAIEKFLDSEEPSQAVRKF